jgi:hypothetical protein
MKKTIFFMQILLLLTAGSAFGADEYYGSNPNPGRTYWFMGPGTKPWNGGKGLSWWDDGQDHFPPDANHNDVVSLDNPLPARCYVTDYNAGCLELHIGDWPADSSSDGGGLYPIPCGLDVNGGTLTVIEDCLMGLHTNTWPSGYAIGDFNIISGDVNIGGNLYVGREGVGMLNMRGGHLKVGGTIWCPGWAMPVTIWQNYLYGTGDMNLYGGTIETNDLQAYYQDGGPTAINIAGGTLILNGDKTSTITDLMSQGKLYPYGGGGYIVLDYNITNVGRTTVTATFDPNRARYPNPANFATGVSLTAQLSWTAGANAVSHNVYFGTTNPPPFIQNQAGTTYTPTLGAITTYYWRIDEVNGPNTWPGNVWRFTTLDPNVASYPNPSNRATNIPIEKVLSWIKGTAADSHNVYLGTSFNDVNTSTTPTATTTNTNYTPPVYLLYDQTYYWRVDEVNSTPPATTWRGPVWSFTTHTYKLIENFDGYGSAPPLSAIWVPHGGATVTKVLGVYGDDTNAMKLHYDNRYSPWDSNATYTLNLTTQDNKRDWVAGGVALLRIHFHGDANNINKIEPLYVTVTDGDTPSKSHKLVYSELRGSLPNDINDVNDILQWSNELWRWWSIDLRNFSDINLANVNYLTIGLGKGAAPGNGSAYTAVYFDDIGLYRPMRIDQGGDADLNNDGAVDYKDIELLAHDWLKSDYNEVNAAIPNPYTDPNLILWYKFDDQSSGTPASSNVSNSSIYGHTYDGTATNVTWQSAGCIDGNCVTFSPDPSTDFITYITVPAAAGPNSLGGQSTVALWIKDAGVLTEFIPVDQVGTQLFQIGPSGRGNLQVSLPDNGYFQYVCGWNTDKNWQDTLTWGLQGYNNRQHPLNTWVHYAFVKDATAAGGEGVMRIYQNGRIVAELSGTTGLFMPNVGDATQSYFTIGAWQWYGQPSTGGYYAGSMDEFRLYNRALSQGEVMTLARVNTLYQPVVSSAEVTGDNIVNFKDFAVVAAKWLANPLLWPY